MEYKDIKIKELQDELIEYDWDNYYLLDSHEIDEQIYVTLIAEDSKIIVNMNDWIGETCATFCIERSRFLELTQEEFDRFINEGYYYNNVSMEGLIL